MHESLVLAYSSSNSPTENSKQTLYSLATNDLSSLRRRVDELWKFHRDRIWLDSFKPFGLEILELRYGALRTRLESLQDRLISYVNGEIDSIPELEVSFNLVFENAGMGMVLDFMRAYTPARGLGTG